MPHTILVVDDEPPLLRLMEFLLSKEGHNMITATNGEEALAQAREHHPDLIVLDIMMPKIDGYQVAEILRADPELRDIPIIMLTAKAQDEDVARGESVGVDTYITKPFVPDELVVVATRYLAQGRDPQ